MDSGSRELISNDPSGKRKREVEHSSDDKHTLAKVKFDQTADRLGAILTQELKRRPAGGGSSDSADKIAELERKIRNLKAEIYDAKEALAERRNGGGSVGACTDCTKNAAANDELKRKLKSAKGLLEREQKQHEETKKDLAERIANVSQLMVENGGLQVELGSLQSQHSLLAAELSDLKLQHDTMHSISPQQYNELAQEKDAAKTAALDAKATLQQALAEKTAAVAALIEAKKSHTDLVSALTADSAALAQHVAKLTFQLAAQAKEHESKLKEVIKSHSELSGNLKTTVSMLEAGLKNEREKVKRLERKVEADQLRNTSTVSAGGGARADVSFDHHDDLSVLTNGTHQAQVSHSASERSVLLASESRNQIQLPGKSTSRAGTRLIISHMHPETASHEIRALAETYGPLVVFAKTGYDSYLVEYADPEDASLALYHIPSRVVAGEKLQCQLSEEASSRPVKTKVSTGSNAAPAVHAHHDRSPAVAAATPTTNTATFVLDKASLNNSDTVKPHQLMVHVMHMAPSKHRLSQDDIKHELSRYGVVKQIRPVADSMAYTVHYYDKSSAENALRNFPPHINGYKIYCKCHFNQLPKTFVPELADAYDRNNDYYDPPASTLSTRAQHRVILQDPLLTENRSIRTEYRTDTRTESRMRKLHCSYCEEEGRRHVVDTHNDDHCFNKLKPNQSKYGGHRGTNYSVASGSSDNNAQFDYERKRGRSESPDRTIRKNVFRESTGTGNANSGTGKPSSSEGGTFDPVTVVRPLSTSR